MLLAVIKTREYHSSLRTPGSDVQVWPMLIFHAKGWALALDETQSAQGEEKDLSWCLCLFLNDKLTFMKRDSENLHMKGPGLKAHSLFKYIYSDAIKLP